MHFHSCTNVHMLESDWGDRMSDRSWFAEQLGRCLLPAELRRALWCGDVDDTAVETVLAQRAGGFTYWCGKHFTLSDRYFAFHYLAAWQRTCSWSCALLVATEYVTCHFRGKTVGQIRAQMKYIYLGCICFTPKCAVKSEKSLIFDGKCTWRVETPL